MTGANGFLGSRILQDLAGRGHEVILMSRRPPGPERVGHKWIQGDCNNLIDCVKAMQSDKFDAVLHVAALPSPSDKMGSDSFGDLARVPETMNTNIMGLYNMLQGALRAEIPVFVQTGSNCIMGHEYRISQTPPTYHYLPLDEDHPGEPEDSYSVSKACGEIILKAFNSAYGMQTYALRSGWVLDANRRLTVAGNRPNPTPSIERVFNAYVAQEDCSLAHILVLEHAHEGQLPGHSCYYVNADDSLALEPTMQLIEQFRPDLLDRLYEPLPGHASFFSNKRLKAATGWKPTISWRECL